MSFLKGLALTFLSLLLLVSVSVFAIAFTLNSTALNADFLNEQIDQLNISEIADEAINELADDEEGLPQSVRQSLSSTLPQVEPQLKTAVGNIIDDVLVYLKEESSNLDLRLVLEENLLNTSFIISLLDEFDLPAMAEDLVGEQFLDDLPQDMSALIGDPGPLVGNITAELEPWLREQMEVIIPPVVGYILGKTQDLSVVIPLDILKETIRDKLWAEISALTTEDLKDIFWESFQESTPLGLRDLLWPAFLEWLPSELSGLPPNQLESYFETYIQGLSQQEADAHLDEFFNQFSLAELETEFNNYFDEFLVLFPISAEIDEETIGTEIPADVDQALTDAEEQLTDAKEYTGWFLAGYWIVIALILVAIGGIVLIKRDVKKSSRFLGIFFLIFGIIEYIGVLITKSVSEDRIPSDIDIPAAVQSWLPQFIDNALGPLEMLAIGFVIIGTVLVVISVLYKRSAAT